VPHALTPGGLIGERGQRRLNQERENLTLPNAATRAKKRSIGALKGEAAGEGGGAVTKKKKLARVASAIGDANANGLGKEVRTHGVSGASKKRGVMGGEGKEYWSSFGNCSTFKAIKEGSAQEPKKRKHARSDRPRARRKRVRPRKTTRPGEGKSRE